MEHIIMIQIMVIYLFLNSVSGFYYGFRKGFNDKIYKNLTFIEALSFAIAVSAGFWILWAIVKLDKHLTGDKNE